jgi:hypothetical protein
VAIYANGEGSHGEVSKRRRGHCASAGDVQLLFSFINNHLESTSGIL